MNSKPRPPTIWLIDEGTPGHTVQTAALGRLMEEQASARTHWIRCRLKLRGFLRPFVRIAVGAAGPSLARRLVRGLYGDATLPDGQRPDFIFSSCGKSAYLNRLLGRITGARTVFIGEIAPFPADWFDLIVSPVDPGAPNVLPCPLIETGRSPAQVAEAAAKHWPAGAPRDCWTMIVGGRSRSHPFEAADWTHLAEGMNRLAREHGVRWLLTTSRRTGADTEASLKAKLDPALIAESTWWSEEPRKVMGAYLHAGAQVFVTQDSLTMMSEAVAAKGHATLVRPARLALGPRDFNHGYMERLHADGRVTRAPASLEGWKAPSAPTSPLDEARRDFAQKFLRWCSDARPR